MSKIYIDSEFLCHTVDDGTRKAVETSFFDSRCDTFIEGYRFVPSGESWTRADGMVFYGEMIAPWKSYAELDAAQRAYEQEQLAEYKVLIDELYAEVTS